MTRNLIKGNKMGRNVLAVRLIGDKVVPEYTYYCLSQDKFFEYEMRYKKGIKMPRGDKSRIMDYQIPIPSLEIQHTLVNKALEIENLIATAKSTLMELDTKRQSMLDEYLQ
jgi:type I restriction enzyme S subunit